MTSIGDQNPPNSSGPANTTGGRQGFFRRRSTWVIGGAVVCGLAIGAGGLAIAAGIDHSGWDRGMRMAFLQRGVAHALDSVGATSQQEAAVHDIIAAKMVELAPDPKERETLRKQALDLLGAPTIDRAAVEKLRAEIIGRVDAKSKLVVDGLLQIADQLKPEQRAELTTRLAAMPPGGPIGFGGPRWGHHWRDDNDDGPEKD